VHDVGSWKPPTSDDVFGMIVAGPATLRTVRQRDLSALTPLLAEPALATYVDNGDLGLDGVIIDMLRVPGLVAARGFVLDGFPGPLSKPKRRMPESGRCGFHDASKCEADRPAVQESAPCPGPARSFMVIVAGRTTQVMGGMGAGTA
jgi:hypothetical protein